jgi:hypothetical protein
MARRPNMLTYRGSAVMRGAVLYKLDLDHDHGRDPLQVLPRSYGVATTVPFRHGHHPPSRRVISENGIVSCEGVMQWFGCKVQPYFGRA